MNASENYGSQLTGCGGRNILQSVFSIRPWQRMMGRGGLVMGSGLILGFPGGTGDKEPAC